MCQPPYSLPAYRCALFQLRPVFQTQPQSHTLYLHCTASTTALLFILCRWYWLSSLPRIHSVLLLSAVSVGDHEGSELLSNPVTPETTGPAVSYRYRCSIPDTESESAGAFMATLHEEGSEAGSIQGQQA